MSRIVAHETGQEVVPLGIGYPPADASFEPLSRSVGERESHDLGWLYPFFDKGSNPARNGLSLTGTGAGNHLKVTASVVDHFLLLR
jgi:hypothetical protein